MTYDKYQDKYHLKTSAHFDRTAFVSDFQYDFLAMSNNYRTAVYINDSWTIEEMDDLVTAAKIKFDAIFKGTLVLPEAVQKFWGYIFATIIVKFRNHHIPDYAEQKRRRKEEEKEKRKAYDWNRYGDFKFNVKFDYGDPTGDWGGTNTDRSSSFDYDSFQEFLKNFSKIFGDQRKNSDWFSQKNERQYYWYNPYGEQRQQKKSSTIPSGSTIEEDLLLLGLTRNTLTIVNLKKQYRVKSLECHPDSGGSQAAFVRLTQAKEHLEQYAR